MIDKYAVPGLKVRNKKRRMRKPIIKVPSSGDMKYVTRYVRDFDMLNGLVRGGTFVNGEYI